MLTLHLSLKRNYWQNDRFKALGGNLPTNQVYFQASKVNDPSSPSYQSQKPGVSTFSVLYKWQMLNASLHTDLLISLKGKGGQLY